MPRDYASQRPYRDKRSRTTSELLSESLEITRPVEVGRSRKAASVSEFSGARSTSFTGSEDTDDDPFDASMRTKSGSASRKNGHSDWGSRPEWMLGPIDDREDDEQAIELPDCVRGNDKQQKPKKKYSLRKHLSGIMEQGEQKIRDFRRSRSQADMELEGSQHRVSFLTGAF